LVLISVLSIEAFPLKISMGVLRPCCLFCFCNPTLQRFTVENQVKVETKKGTRCATPGAISRPQDRPAKNVGLRTNVDSSRFESRRIGQHWFAKAEAWAGHTWYHQSQKSNSLDVIYTNKAGQPRPTYFYMSRLFCLGNPSARVQQGQGPQYVPGCQYGILAACTPT
jgi:hypothetical protein